MHHPAHRATLDKRVALVTGANKGIGRLFGADYSPSKTALRAISLAFAIELENTNIKVDIVAAGFTARDLNGFRGTRSVEQGAREGVPLAFIGPDSPTGRSQTKMAWRRGDVVPDRPALPA